MLKIGLTGSIGSGKTTVLRILKEKGAGVFSCDWIVHQIYNNPDDSTCGEVGRVFPEAKEKGIISREKLAEIVFSDKEKLVKLEKIVHPAVLKALREWLRGEKGKRVVVAEVPLLFEKKLDKLFDKVVLVKAENKILLERLKKNGLTRTEIKKRLSFYLPSQKKEKKSDFVLINNSELNKLKKEVSLLWQKINKI